jgi:hypothetical protein
MLPPMSNEPTRDAAAAYERLAGTAAIAAGIGGIVYSVAFLGGVVAGKAPELGLAVASIALMVGGFLSVLVLVALYRRLLDTAAAVGLLGLMLVAVGATGAMVHGGYDLANSIHAPVTDVLAEAELPSPIDPRGLLTFALSGLGLLVLAWQSRRSGTLPGNLATLGVTVGALLIVVYLGRLIILTPTNLLVAIPAAATGLILSPLFYIWLGIELRRR